MKNKKTKVSSQPDAAVKKLKRYRGKIDKLDAALLKTLQKRDEVVAKIGRLKNESGLPVVQAKRSAEILKDRSKRAKELALNPRFIRKIFELIQQEAIDRQMKRHQ